MPQRRRRTTLVQCTTEEWARLERLNALTTRAAMLVGETGAVNYPEAIAIVRCMADEAIPQEDTPS